MFPNVCISTEPWKGNKLCFLTSFLKINIQSNEFHDGLFIQFAFVDHLFSFFSGVSTSIPLVPSPQQLPPSHIHPFPTFFLPSPFWTCNTIISSSIPFLANVVDFIFLNRGIKFHCIYEPHFPHAFICWWTSRLSPFLLRKRGCVSKKENFTIFLCIYIYGNGINHPQTGRLGMTVVTYFTYKTLIWVGLWRGNHLLHPVASVRAVGPTFTTIICVPDWQPWA